MTITKAMHEWLGWVADGGVIERTATSRPEAVRCHKRIAWPMLDKLEEAGLIVWSELYTVGEKYPIRKCKVLLTATGSALASKER